MVVARRDPRRQDRHRAAARRAAPAAKAVGSVDLVDRDVGLDDDAAPGGRGVPLVDGHRAGRSANTLAAYRRDLTGYCVVARRARRDVARASTGDARRATSASAGCRGRAVVRRPAGWRRSACCTDSWSRRAVGPTTRPPTSTASACRPASPTAHRGQVTALLAAPAVTDPVACAIGRCWSCCTRPERASLRPAGCRSATSISTEQHGPPVRQGLEGADRPLRPARRGSAWPVARAVRTAASRARRWTRRGDAEAVFLNHRGARLSRQAAWAMVKQYGDRIGLGDAVAARAAALVCDPPARSRRRPADRPGAARPRVDLDDAGVHQGQPGAAVRGVPIGRTRGPWVDEHRSPPGHLARRFVTLAVAA